MQWTHNQWIEYFSNQLKQFKIHNYTAKIQSEAFHFCIKDMTSQLSAVILDFSENFTMKCQNETQNAFFARGNVTLLTGVIYFNNTLRSFAIISNCLRHDKYLVYACKKKIVELILKEMPIVSEIIWFSDGAPAHFKNSFSISNLLLLEKEHKINMKWSFFAPGHGKGPADGVGGNVKHMVERRIFA